MHRREIELLAPAKNLECGIAAIDHGADAVYIGAPSFGARAAASNSLEDLAQLVEYAHLYNVKIYATVNTILKEEELEDTEKMIGDLYRIGIDALIIQDMGILNMNLPPIPLHASTQCDSRSVEKVKFLQKTGFQQVVLPREFSLNEIHQVHSACPNVALEVFVHGALCVSYSGQCYVSEAMTKRSANRGSCSQFCRLPFTMKDADDKTIVKDKHLLSLKDLNQIERLENLLDAGASSLKIEGRLKDVAYVKNVTAAYRQALDKIFKRRKEYVAASSGKTEFLFEPSLDKSFSRGSTDFFLEGRQKDIACFDTPKSLGEEMGYMKERRGNFFIVAGVKPFHNGDGACFIDKEGKLQGFRVNKVEGNKIFPLDMPDIQPKTTVYRNYDHEFEKQLAKESATRTIPISIVLKDVDGGFDLVFTDDLDHSVTQFISSDKELARSPQKENIIKQLTKLGNTPFVAETAHIELDGEWFIPSSLLGEARRVAVEKLIEERKTNYKRLEQVFKPTKHPYIVSSLSYLGNVMNSKAESFYAAHGVTQISPAFEKEPVDDAILMLCKHCIRYAMGWCPTYQQDKSPYREPFRLIDPNGNEFNLKFDCKNCQMKVLKKKN